MIDYKYIEKVRNENIDNPNYPVIYWSSGDKIYVKIGAFEQNNMAVEEAKESFKDNKLFIDELDFLLQSKIHTEDPYDIFDEDISEKIYQQETIKSKIDIEKIQEEIDSKVAEIIMELGLEKSDDFLTQLKNCCLVQKYIAEHNSYDEKIMVEKESYSSDEIVILDLYNAVVLHNGVCTSNSLMFKKILKQIGINVEVVGLFSSEGGIHAANIVELDGAYYYFDTTLETTIYEENKDKTNGRIILCCAGLGENMYTQFYTPQVVLPDNPLDDVGEIPHNIASESIPPDIINDLVSAEIYQNPKK